jgi:hypothetical protein
MNLLARLALAAVVYAWSIWALTDDLSLWRTDLVGSIIWTSIIVGGLTVCTRFVLSCVVLASSEMTARGIFRTWTVRKVDVTGIETEPFRRSVLARLRMADGRSVPLPMAVQGGAKPMADFVACLEAWRLGAATDPHA